MKHTTNDPNTANPAPRRTGELTLFESAAALDVSADLDQRATRCCASLQTPLPPELRPKERLIEAGAKALSASELLAMLLGGEPAAALKLAAELICVLGGLVGLRKTSYHDLIGSGLDEERAATLSAAVELAKRLSCARDTDRPVISSPEDVNALLGARMRDLDREHFVVVLLDTKNHVIATPTVSVGTLSSSLVHPREVFRAAIKAGAASVILAHNHPSSHLEPSAEDRQVTERLAQVGKHIGIEVLDHLIFGEGYLSLKERGLL